MGADSRGGGTLCAEVKTRQPLSVLPWMLLGVLAQRKIQARVFWGMRYWRRHLQKQNPNTRIPFKQNY